MHEDFFGFRRKGMPTTVGLSLMVLLVPIRKVGKAMISMPQIQSIPFASQER